jgi:DNA-binding transcriptional ArsR family regulator
VTTPIDATLDALADTTRRGAIEMLAGGPLTPSEIATRLGVSRAALTGHLRSLRLAGLVEATLDPADSRRHIYAIRPDPLRDLSEWSEEVTRFWADQLASYARHVAEVADG